MALDAVVHPQDYSMGYFCKEFFTLGGGVGGGLGHGSFDLQEQKGFVKLLGQGMMEHCADGGNWAEYTSSPSVLQNTKEWDPNSSPEACAGDYKVPFLEGSMTATIMKEPQAAAAATPAAAGKRKRQRTRTCKNKEELENQRRTHIAVERNRRKQMNDYLAVIRSLMPPSYVQRGDQASIIGGAINFVKELEQHLQSLEEKKMTTNSAVNGDNGGVLPPIFADFFTFPQYSITRSSSQSPSPSSAQSSNSKPVITSTRPEGNAANKNNKRTALGDIEVSMAESHANLKILSKKRPRQLLKLVSGLQCMWFTILHLNVTTTFDQRVLYSISVKVEEGCRLTTVDEIADAVNHLLGRIEEEAV